MTANRKYRCAGWLFPAAMLFGIGGAGICVNPSPVVLASEEDEVKQQQTAGRQRMNGEEAQSVEDKTRLLYVKALDAALKEAAKHHDLARKFKVTVQPSDVGWSVWLVFLPETPGDDVMIRVTRDGKVQSIGGI